MRDHQTGSAVGAPLGAVLEHWAGEDPNRRDVAATLVALERGLVALSGRIARGALDGDMGEVLHSGEAGEGQKKLDVLADEFVISALRGGPSRPSPRRRTIFPCCSTRRRRSSSRSIRSTGRPTSTPTCRRHHLLGAAAAAGHSPGERRILPAIGPGSARRGLCHLRAAHGAPRHRRRRHDALRARSGVAELPARRGARRDRQRARASSPSTCRTTGTGTSRSAFISTIA